MLDLVGDDENQLPAQLKNKAIITSSFDNKLAHIQAYVQNNREKKMMIFCETKNDVRKFEGLEFAKFLPIHGDMEQPARERALGKFREGGSRHILVGTDVASRGLDVDDIDVVIHLECRQ
jgi:superfamily II DNA/RNA helicase